MFQVLGSLQQGRMAVIVDRIANREVASDTRYLHVRDALMQRKITLDGKPAYISGRLKKFATVWQRKDICKQVEFSWPAVKRIIQSGGAFLS